MFLEIDTAVHASSCSLKAFCEVPGPLKKALLMCVWSMNSTAVIFPRILLVKQNGEPTFHRNCFLFCSTSRVDSAARMPCKSD